MDEMEILRFTKPGVRVLRRGASKAAKVLAVSEGSIYFDRPHKLSKLPLQMPAKDFVRHVLDGTIRIFGHESLATNPRLFD